MRPVIQLTSVLVSTTLLLTGCAGGAADPPAASPTVDTKVPAKPAGAATASPVAAAKSASSQVACPDFPNVQIPMADPTGESFTLVWDHSTTIPGTAYETEITETFPQLVKDATNGRVTIDMKIGQLPAAQTLYAVQNGEVDGGTPVSVYYGELYGLNWVSIPGLLLSRQDLQKALEAVKPELTETAQQFNAVSLLYGPWSRQVMWGKEPLDEIEDFQGKKIRSWGGQSVTMINEIGASPVSMTFSEVYVAAQRGVVDVVGTGLGPGNAIKLYEVTPVVSNWRYAEPIWALLVNQDKWNEMPADVQAAVQGAADCISARIWPETDEEEVRVDQELKDRGISFVDPKPGEMDKLVQRAQPAWDEWLQAAGPEGRQILNKVLQAIGRERPA